MSVICILLVLFVCVVYCPANNMKLKQVLVFSRHNIRTPMEIKHLQRFSPKKFPMRYQQAGVLTQKGAIMEGYMAEYFTEWFKSEQFLQDKCPSAETVHVYANSMNRTILTAKAFVDSAFKDCNISVHYKHTVHEESDPNFAPIVHNTTDAFRTMVFNEVRQKLKNSKLRAAFLELNNILNIKNSEICKSESICDLTDISKNKINFEVGRELKVIGPLHIGISVVDAFAMSYYDGMPLEDIAWGLVKTAEKWKMVTEINRLDQNIRYTTVADDIATPLIKYFANIFLNYNEMPKFMLIVGHDYNQNSIFSSMGFKKIHLPNHYELFPIGGKIVFQRWTDAKSDYLKIEYVYPTWTQIRNGTKFSMDNPPQRVLLQLQWCNIDGNGFCTWYEFINKLGLFK